MGHDLSKPENRLGIAAVSHITQFDQDDLLLLRKEFEANQMMKLKKKKNDDPSAPIHKYWAETNLHRKQFNLALERVRFHESDKEILSRLFTMLDKTGDDVVHYPEFLVALATLVKTDLVSKFELAFDLFDAQKSGEVSKFELVFVLGTMNTTSSYFGDTPLSKKEIQQIVHDQFPQSSNKSSTEKECEDPKMMYIGKIAKIVQHPHICTFLDQLA